MNGLRETARTLVAAALEAADPRAAVRRALSAGHGGEGRISCCGEELAVRGRLHLVAVGKAASAMCAGAAEALAGLSGIPGKVASMLVVIPHGYSFDPSAVAPAFPPVEVLRAGHPVPDEAGLAAARRVLAVVEGIPPEDHGILLLSGGGSSLLALPADGVGLADKQATTALLLASGADITEINTVRKHLSAIKGGRLAARCRGSIETLAISDVVGDELATIASGPTVADPGTFAEAWATLERRGIAGRVPAPVVHALREGMDGAREETPKSLPDRHRAWVIASAIAALNETRSSASGTVSSATALKMR